MFKCQITGEYSKLGEKLHKVVVAKRQRVYTRKFRNEETRQIEEVEVGHGWEIVREVSASQEGMERWAKWTDEERAAFLKHLD
jgi:hypothetical protein